MSPPFPRQEKMCQEGQKTDIDGYYDEMFRFEYMDDTVSTPKELLQAEHEKRFERIRFCNHTWTEDEMTRIGNAARFVYPASKPV